MSEIKKPLPKKPGKPEEVKVVVRAAPPLKRAVPKPDAEVPAKPGPHKPAAPPAAAAKPAPVVKAASPLKPSATTGSAALSAPPAKPAATPGPSAKPAATTGLAAAAPKPAATSAPTGSAAVPHPPAGKPAPQAQAPAAKPAVLAPSARPATPPPPSATAGPARPGHPPAPGPRPAGQFRPAAPQAAPARPAPHAHPPKHAPAAPKPAAPPAPPKPRQGIVFREGWIVKDAADAMKIRPKDLLEKLAAKGFTADLNDFVDADTVAAVAKATHFDAEFITLDQAMRQLAEAKTSELVQRSPVVTIMGHVDHGKTTLLDAIRSSNLVDKESGGITQHIGAYRVAVKNRTITFIDTPGHEAFTRLRARGAKATDIVILVIAADDGIMPQTKEAIDHAKAANVPIIVAINKVDKPDANIDRVKQQLSKENLLVEDWGGKTISVEVSAKDKKTIADLLEMILLLSDMQELKANPRVPAQGTVLEARLDSQKGPLATVIVQQGTLEQGQAFVSGLTFGKVRAMFDEHGKVLKSAGPSMPVEIMGFADVPVAGDPFQVMDDPTAAKQVVGFRKVLAKKPETARDSGVTLDDLFKKIEGGQAKDLNLVLKADVQGSVEVLADVVPPLATEKVKINIIRAATGNITEADVLLASATKAVVIGYNVKPNPKILELAKKEEVEIRTYKIIYQLTDELKKAVIGLLDPIIKETFQGRAEVRKIFQIPKVGMIAGCYVQDGRITRNAEARVLRGKEVLHQGRITSLKHLKENVAEVKKDLECGIGVGGFNGLQPGDVIEVFVREKVQPV
ncbi:MAG: translation initiation factor IF-2 [Candidatus Aminicenantes bacterium]|nr:translation initiation factor IF-2 [Candidatus Aminicenantes bacterium]